MGKTPDFEITDYGDSTSISGNGHYGIRSVTVDLSPEGALEIVEIMNEVKDRDRITAISMEIGGITIASDKDDHEHLSPSWLQIDTVIKSDSFTVSSIEDHGDFTVECTVERATIEEYLVTNDLIPASERRSKPALTAAPATPRP